MINPEAVDVRDGKCRECGSPAAVCANCYGTGKKRRDQKRCDACKGWGLKAFCGTAKRGTPNPCREAFYAKRRRRPKRAKAA